MIRTICSGIVLLGCGTLGGIAFRVRREGDVALVVKEGAAGLSPRSGRFTCGRRLEARGGGGVSHRHGLRRRRRGSFRAEPGAPVQAETPRRGKARRLADRLLRRPRLRGRRSRVRGFSCEGVWRALSRSSSKRPIGFPRRFARRRAPSGCACPQATSRLSSRVRFPPFGHHLGQLRESPPEKLRGARSRLLRRRRRAFSPTGLRKAAWHRRFSIAGRAPCVYSRGVDREGRRRRSASSCAAEGVVRHVGFAPFVSICGCTDGFRKGSGMPESVERQTLGFFEGRKKPDQGIDVAACGDDGLVAAGNRPDRARHVGACRAL